MIVKSLRFQVAARAKADWEAGNPELLGNTAAHGSREMGIETDTGRARYGAGPWNTLPYLKADPVDGDYGDITVAGAAWSIGTAKVTTAKLAASSVTTAKLADDAVSTAKIADAAVTNAKQANISSGRIKGRLSGGAGPVEDLTGPQVTGLLTTFSAAAQGLVGASGGGTVKFLRADGAWTDALTVASLAATGALSGSSLGIGTTSPTAVAEIRDVAPDLALSKTGSTSVSYGCRFRQGSGATDYASITFQLNTAELRTTAGYAGYGGFHTWFANGAEIMRLLTDGQLLLKSLRMTNLPTLADEAAAVAAGLASGTVYKTAAGELRIKL